MSKLICKIADHFMTVVCFGVLAQHKNMGCMVLYGCECTFIFKLCLVSVNLLSGH